MEAPCHARPANSSGPQKSGAFAVQARLQDALIDALNGPERSVFDA